MASMQRQSTQSSVLSPQSFLLAGAVALFMGFLALPVLALLMRVPLSELRDYAARPVVLEALRLSLLTSLASLTLIALFGTPTAFALGRYNFRGKQVLETLVEIPLVM